MEYCTWQQGLRKNISIYKDTRYLFIFRLIEQTNMKGDVARLNFAYFPLVMCKTRPQALKPAKPSQAEPPKAEPW